MSQLGMNLKLYYTFIANLSALHSLNKYIQILFDNKEQNLYIYVFSKNTSKLHFHDGNPKSRSCFLTDNGSHRTCCKVKKCSQLQTVIFPGKCPNISLEMSFGGCSADCLTEVQFKGLLLSLDRLFLILRGHSSDCPELPWL